MDVLQTQWCGWKEWGFRVEQLARLEVCFISSPGQDAVARITSAPRTKVNLGWRPTFLGQIGIPQERLPSSVSIAAGLHAGNTKLVISCLPVVSEEGGGG